MLNGDPLVQSAGDGEGKKLSSRIANDGKRIEELLEV